MLITKFNHGLTLNIQVSTHMLKSIIKPFHSSSSRNFVISTDDRTHISITLTTNRHDVKQRHCQINLFEIFQDWFGQERRIASSQNGRQEKQL